MGDTSQAGRKARLVKAGCNTDAEPRKITLEEIFAQIAILERAFNGFIEQARKTAILYDQMQRQAQEPPPPTTE